MSALKALFINKVLKKYRVSFAYTLSWTKKLYRIGQLEFKNFKLQVENEAKSTWSYYTSYEYLLQHSINTQDSYYKRYYVLMKEHTLGAQTIINMIQAQKDHNNASIQMIRQEMNYKTYLFTLHKLMGNFTRMILTSGINY